MELAEFIAARLDETEAAAQAATPGRWLALDGGVQSADDETQWPVSQSESDRDRGDRVHIARHDPARALREIAAKRAILAVHARLGDSVWCQTCDPGANPFGDSDASYPCRTLRLLAAIWSDHDQYRPEWAPLG